MPISTPLGQIIRVDGLVDSAKESAESFPDSKTSALRFIAEHRNLLGVTPNEVQLERVVSSSSGVETLRFSQVIAGARVEGSLVALSMSAAHRVLSYSAITISLDPQFNAQPRMSAEAARLALQNEIARVSNVGPTNVELGEVQLAVVDSRLVDQAPMGDTLAWKAMTTVNSNPLTASWSFISDVTGTLIAAGRITRGITYQPNVCDLQAASLSDYAWQNSAAGVNLIQNLTVRKTGVSYNYIDTTTGLYPLCGTKYAGANGPSAATAVANINTTWDFYKNVIGIDINDEVWLGNIAPTVNGDRNPRISAYINVCFNDKTSDCPNYPNASWAPWSSKLCRSYACSGIFMGARYDQALDVIAHELTHGITFSLAFTDYLSDTSEAGALSEGLSDVFGESVERLSPSAAPDPSWKIAENVTSGSGAGPYREMQTGTSYQWNGSTLNVPAITSSWTADDSHTNNGPINRLAWLLANGSDSGVPTIAPLGSVPSDGICHLLSECTGITRMNVLMYAALPRLSSSSSYFDFGKALINACYTLVAQKTDGFNAASCTSVQQALDVTGITKLSLTNTTRALGKVRPKSWKVTAQVRTLTGAVPSYLPMKLEQFDGKNWVTVAQGERTCKAFCTTLNGNVSFTVKWPKVTQYRISAVLPVGAQLYLSKVFKL